MAEHKKRSFMKALSWRISGSGLTILMVFFFTGKISLSLGIGAVEVVSKFLFYYLHERIWDRISWAKIEPLTEEPEYAELSD